MKQHTNDNRLRGIRGGSWIDDDASWMRPSERCSAFASRFGTVGFRTTLAGRLPRV